MTTTTKRREKRIGEIVDMLKIIEKELDAAYFSDRPMKKIGIKIQNLIDEFYILANAYNIKTGEIA